MVSDETIAMARAIPILDVAGLVTSAIFYDKKITFCCSICGKTYTSFKLNLDSNSAHCFCCGLHYDTIDFVQRYANLNFPAAIKFLKDNFPQYFNKNFTPAKPVETTKKYERIVISSERASEILRIIHEYSLSVMADRTLSSKGRNYLASRGIYDEQIEKFRIGFIPYDEKILNYFQEKGITEDEMTVIKIKNSINKCSVMDRIVYPFETNERITALCYRSIYPNIEKKYRYMNSGSIGTTQISNGLFGLSQLGDNVNNVVCCEGAMDAIALSEYGVPAVALGGLIMNAERYSLLRNKAKNITLLLDTDEAGRNASMEIARNYSDIYIAELPEENDPFDYVRKYDGGEIPLLVYDGFTAKEFLEKYKENQ